MDRKFCELQSDLAGTDNIMLYPLTHPQKRIWYIEKIYPNTPVYILGGPSIINGPIDIHLFDRVINIFIKKNDGLRLQFIEQNGEVMQYISEFKNQRIDFFDFSKYDYPDAEFEKWAEDEIKTPFIIEKSRLYYFALYKISENRFGIYVKFHHAISDGWSIEIASQSIMGIYMMLLKGEDVNEDVEYSYLEYIENEHKYLLSERYIKNKSYWMEKYRDLPGCLDSNSSEENSGNRVVYTLENELSDSVRNFTTEKKLSLNTYFIVAYLIYVYLSSQKEDIIIGTPVLNRSGKREKNIFGMFTSTMPCRIKIDTEDTISKIFEKVNSELKECYFNQKYPYDLLVQDINLKKQGYDSLFQVCINYYNTKLHKELDGYSTENVEMYNGYQMYALQLIIKDWSDKGNITLTFDYKVNEYSSRQIYQIYDCIINISKQLLSAYDQKISIINILSNDKIDKQINKFNSTKALYPNNKNIYQLFQEQAEKTPNNIAVCFENSQITYTELNEKANQLARKLRNRKVKPNTIVGLMVTHSIEAVIGILAIIKSGGAYLPIDPEYPIDRIEYMLEDSQSKLILTNCLDNQMFSFNGEIIDLNDKELYSGESSNLTLVNKSEDLVYVIYTSGSTGKPKGVMIEHKGLVNYIWWAKSMYIKNVNDSFAFYSSLSFDLTVTSIFTPLIGGNSIIIYKDDGEEYVLYRIVKENKATIVKLTPSHLSLLKDLNNKNSSIKRFIVGGEDLKVRLASDIHSSFGGDIEIYNEYGPTETVVGCMIYKYNYEKDRRVSVPIGKPSDNVQIYILDKNLKPLPEGSIGELYISGDGVARGYLNRPDLTRERFIQNPYIIGERMYKTGDLAIFLENEEIEYIGRSDHQVKIRGYRIELGEIEKRILEHKFVTNTVVIDREDVNGGKYLCAYIVTLGEFSTKELRKSLLEHLPEYMVPSHYVTIKDIPLTQNGKVNRSLLPLPEENKNEASEYVPPRNDKERVLIAVLEEILKKSNLGVNCNFFYNGGDSIKAIQIAGKLNEKGFKIKVRDILSHPVAEDMALCLEYGNLIHDDAPIKGTFRPTPIISWFLAQNFENINHYNQSVLLDLKHEISVVELTSIMNELVKCHDSLRLNYDKQTNEIFYNEVYLTKANTVDFYDLSGLTNIEQDLNMVQLGKIVKSSFDIENNILIKACIFDLGERGRKILLTAHHLIIDGVSWRILLEDFATIFNQIKSGIGIVELLKTHSMQKWASQLEKYAGNTPEDEMTYWKRILEQDFEYPQDYRTENDRLDRCVTLTGFLDENETHQLIDGANHAYNTKAEELMIAALYLTIRNSVNKEELVIELEGHGREDIFEDIDVSRTIGWFTSIYPVLLCQGGTELSEIIKAVKEQIRNIPNKGFGFGVLKYYSELFTSNKSKHVRFNYLGDSDNISQNDLFEISDDNLGNDSSDNNHMTCLLDINAMIINKKLKISITYSSNKFINETMETFLKTLFDTLRKIINFCSSREYKEYTPSDFDMLNLAVDDLDNIINQF